MKNPWVWAIGILVWLLVFRASPEAVAVVLTLPGATVALAYVVMLVVVLYQGLVQTPSKVVTRMRHPVMPYPPAGQEPAYRQYFDGQAMSDQQEILAEWFVRCREETRDMQRRIDRGLLSGQPWYAWLIGSILLVGMWLTVGIAAALAAVFAAAQSALLLLLHAGARLTTWLLWGLDWSWRKVRGVTITCPDCSLRMSYPVYECDRCGKRHRDVRPGAYGVFSRICECTRPLPTLLLFGSYKRDAFCPECGKPLAERSGTSAETILPVFGGSGAGKTRLMFTLIAALDNAAARRDIELELPDPETRRRYEELKHRIQHGHDPDKTLVAELPHAYQARITPDRGASRLLQVFDAAGERFTRSEPAQELRYLRLARTFVFVLDPLAVDAFWNRLAPADQQRLARHRQSAYSTEQVLQLTVDTVRAMRVPTGKARLAVAVSKHDLLEGTAPLNGVGSGSSELETWLDCTLGLGNLIRSTRHDFADTRFFLTAAVLDAEGNADRSVIPLLEWLLDGEHIRLEL